MYNPKFKYEPVPRVVIEGRRYYATPDGNNLPSVTTILDQTKPEEKRKALNQWRARVGVEKAQQITSEAANRGTRMHAYLEHYVKTGQRKERGSNPFSWPSHVMAEEIINQGLINVTEFWGIEVPLYFPAIYAGTTDGAGIHLNEEAILDYKQTNKPKRREWIEDYFLQLAAYANAHNEVYGTKIRKGVIFMCSADNQYQEFVIEGVDFDKYSDAWFVRLEQYYSSFVQ